MAFQSAQRNSNPVSQFPRGNNEQWKAGGFLNFYLPTARGRRKVGYIPLHENKAFDAAIIERLKAGGDEAIKALQEVLEIEFNDGEASDENLPVF